MPLTHRRSIFVVLGLGLLLAGCQTPRELLFDGDGDGGGTACAEGCHGSTASLAPPAGVWAAGGKTSATDRGVGAHQAHLAGGALSLPIPCDACHLVPTAVDAPGHMDTALPAEVTFSGLAQSDGAAPAWDGTTCSGSYCHGATLSGGKLTAPAWTKVDGTQAACGTCHGLPPGDGHPAGTSCQLCHSKVVDASGAIIAPALHINGKVDADTSGSGCSGCHGSADNAAPPVDTQGNSATSARGVGAHQAHVRASSQHAAIGCAECHPMPTSVDAAGHMDTPLPAELLFGALSKTGGAQPSWDTTTLSCAGTYCHGALEGGGNPAPTWNTGQHMVCGSCHGLPPAKGRTGATHPAAGLADCVTCHPAVVNGAGQIVDAALHVNGKVDFN